MHQTKVLLNDALSQRLAGNWQDAVTLSEQAFRASCAAGDVDDITEAILTIAHSYREMGDLDSAIEYYELAHTLATLHSSDGHASRALNGIGIVLQQRGSMDGAEAAYNEARALAAAVDDALTIGNIDMNLGTLHTVRGNTAAAHCCYNASLACYESIRHDRGIVGVLNNMGMLYIDSGQLAEADECLERALTVSMQTEDVLSAGIVQINRTELLIARGSLLEARSSCDDAHEIFARLREDSGRSEALKHYGVIYRETGKLYLAEAHLKSAIDIALGKYPLQEAEAQRELALVLRLMGRNRDALTALNRAYNLFGLLQANQDKADIRERLDQLESDFLSVVSYWSDSIDEIDQYTRGHCQRVADYACSLAERVGFRRQDIAWFRMGALLHDVGKTSIPIELVNKPGDLLPSERASMERHTELGEELLSEIEFPWDIRPMVRSHHERWDGKGYPDGLGGEGIPLSARILHIADVFDALTTTRSYRLRLCPKEALAVMRRDPGSFDPYLFQLFESIVADTSVAVASTSEPVRAGVTE